MTTVNTKMKAAQKLIADCEKNLQENEYNMRKMKGVRLSHSDVETAMLYANTILQYGTYEGILMHPFGEVGMLLGKYGLSEET